MRRVASAWTWTGVTTSGVNGVGRWGRGDVCECVPWRSEVRGEVGCLGLPRGKPAACAVDGGMASSTTRERAHVGTRARVVVAPALVEVDADHPRLGGRACVPGAGLVGPWSLGRPV